MRFKKILTLFIAVPMFLASCVMNNGLCYEHVDNNKDGLCDVCGTAVKTDGGSHSHDEDIPGNPCTTHVDQNFDGKCDNCGADLSVAPHEHIDGDQNGQCDICGASMIICNDHIDHNGDGKCDICGATMPPVTGDVTVYLVLSSVGLYKGNVGVNYPDVNVENAIQFIAPVGTALPGKEDVTHLYKSADFTSWVAYEGAGAPTAYTTVPAVNNKILYAQFTPNGQDPDVPQPDDPTPTGETKAYTLKTDFGSENWSVADPKIYVYCWDGSGNNRAYQCSKVDDNTYSFEIYTYYTDLLFLRVNPTATFDVQQWNDVWNQSDDLHIDSTKSTAQITSWDGGNQGHSTVAWVA